MAVDVRLVRRVHGGPLSPDVVRTVDVAVDPATAFEVFTAEIDAWYARGPYSWHDPDRAIGIRFEPHVGGRWLEVHDAETGEGVEIGRIRAWEPGRRVLVSFTSSWLPPEPPTEVEIRFEAVPTGTRVTLEHRGIDQLPPDVARAWRSRAWKALMATFAEYVGATRA
jgi:uncharacterized protein YndB with AHSA1/START domain